MKLADRSETVCFETAFGDRRRDRQEAWRGPVKSAFPVRSARNEDRKPVIAAHTGHIGLAERQQGTHSAFTALSVVLGKAHRRCRPHPHPALDGNQADRGKSVLLQPPRPQHRIGSRSGRRCSPRPGAIGVPAGPGQLGVGAHGTVVGWRHGRRQAGQTPSPKGRTSAPADGLHCPRSRWARSEVQPPSPRQLRPAPGPCVEPGRSPRPGHRRRCRAARIAPTGPPQAAQGSPWLHLRMPR